jgi:hypothetical protein
MGVKSLFLTNHTKESRLDLHLLTIALKAGSTMKSMVRSWKTWGQPLNKDKTDV